MLGADVPPLPPGIDAGYLIDLRDFEVEAEEDAEAFERNDDGYYGQPDLVV